MSGRSGAGSHDLSPSYSTRSAHSMSFDSRRIHDVPDDPLAFEGRPPEAVIATHPATGLQLTVHAAAVNAVMAGCLPEYFPVLVAAFEAMDKPGFNFHGSA